MTTQWSTFNTSSTTGAVFGFLLLCLLWHFRPVYNMFHQQQCLKFLMMQSVSLWSISLIRVYVIGIAVAIHLSYNDSKENETISQAIDCLHEPGNLLFVCSTLAIYTHDPVYEVIGQLDIMTALAQIWLLDPA
ncbi:hypothetical protein ARMSODRAFT_51215 [Armillaria solidipes]|uniref:Uncharacterized protein n=1 Tax=Armillaria solidipes TaxID=1076256 RepID=A0A2H3CRE2_9AGAR|nr:hypothetical protein ARMSODRAFT_51215 [Armillaria solidipes]